MTPLFKNWPRYRLRFCKMLDFQLIFLLAYLQVVKMYLCIPINMVKSTDWFKKGPSRNKWFRHSLQIYVWFSYRVVIKTFGRTSVPNSNLIYLSTPLGLKDAIPHKLCPPPSPMSVLHTLKKSLKGLFYLFFSPWKSTQKVFSLWKSRAKFDEKSLEIKPPISGIA